MIWKTEKIENICEVKGGKRLPKGKVLSIEKTNFPYIRVTDFENYGVNLSNIKYISQDIFEEIQRYTITDDDVFISIAGTIGLTGIVPSCLSGANLTENAAKLTNFNLNKISKKFLMYCLSSPKIQRNIQASTVKNAQPKLALSRIKSLEISLPPIAEQKKIATVLSLVQEAISQQERLINLTTELKKALMQKLFTEGTRNEPQKMTAIGLIPESWDVFRLDEIAESFQYGTSVKCDYAIEGYPVLRIPNVIGGHVDMSDLKYGKPKKNEIDNLKLQQGDLLFVRTNGTRENAGRCSMYRDEINNDCYYASYLIRVRLDQNKLSPIFLEEYTRTKLGISFLSGQAIRTADGKFNINSGTLQRMLVPQPAIEKQREIAQNAEYLDTKINIFSNKKKILTELFQTLLHQLMTAQIRVDDLDLSALNIEP